LVSVEGRVGGQSLFDRLQRIRQAAAGLHGEPFIDDQRFVLPAFVEIGEGGFCVRSLGVLGQCGKGGKLVGHVVGCCGTAAMASWRTGVAVEFKQVAQAEVAQGTAAGVCAEFGVVGALGGEGGVDTGQFALRPVLQGQVAAQSVAGGVQSLRIYNTAMRLGQR
jgi:hypothetical protein